MVKTKDLNEHLKRISEVKKFENNEIDLIERIRRNSLKENFKNILLYSVFLYFPFILIILGIFSSSKIF